MVDTGIQPAVFLLAIVAGLANVLGGGLILVRRQWPIVALRRILAASAGFLLAVAFLELIPESLEASSSNAVWILGGFVAIYVLQQFVLGRHVHAPGAVGSHSHGQGCERCNSGNAGAGALAGGYENPDVDRVAPRSSIGRAAFTGMLLHTFFDGVSLAAGFAVSTRAGILVFIAVLLHKLPDGLVIASIMLAADLGRRQAFLSSLALGIATVAGFSTMSLLSGASTSTGTAANPVEIASVALALSAGAFIYVAASDLIPEVLMEKEKDLPILVIGGMLVFYATEVVLSLVGLH